MEIGPNSAFFPVVGLAAAFLVVLAAQSGQKDKFSATWWGETIGATFGIGLIVFTPILFVAASCLG
ncbi:hypothetical protein N9R12_02685 [Actinomycetota bacterium]|nr:hypothetical protein [Actinomycetota bacterium]